MKINILVFAQARKTFGFSSLTADCIPSDTPRAIVNALNPEASLSHLRVALDSEYVTWDTPVGTAFELAIIPPGLRRLEERCAAE